MPRIVDDTSAKGFWADSFQEGDYIIIKNRPCKIVHLSKSEIDVRGHKIHFVGLDIFTGKKLEEMAPETKIMISPEVTFTEMQLLDITDDGFLALIDKENTLRRMSNRSQKHLRCKLGEPGKKGSILLWWKKWRRWVKRQWSMRGRNLK